MISKLRTGILRANPTWVRRVLGIGGVCTILAIVASCGGGGGGGGTPTQPGPPTATLNVDIQDFQFSPKSITVNPGDTVTWTLKGSPSIGHTVTEQNGLFSSGMIFNSANMTFSHTFTAADNGHTFQYYCQTHQGCCMMQGSVRVGSGAPAPNPGY